MRLDDYGTEVGYDGAGREIEAFVSSVIRTDGQYQQLRERLITTEFEITLCGQDRSKYHLDDWLSKLYKDLDENLVPLIYLQVSKYDGASTDTDGTVVSGFSGAEFEVFCEDQLTNLGWTVRRKGGTGDQGVDLIASKDGAVLAIQCKRFSSPVGNAAVQQVEAGRRFEDADIAVVISNHEFTRSAKQLAQKLNVVLLHYSDLDKLDYLLK